MRTRNPQANASRIFPKAERAERSIFYTQAGRARLLDAVRDLIARKLHQNATQAFAGSAGVNGELLDAVNNDQLQHLHAKPQTLLNR